MTTTAAYPTTMSELRGEPPSSGIWPNYGGSGHLHGRLSSGVDPSFPNPAARPRSDHTSVEPSAYSYHRFSQDEPEAYDRHAQAQAAQAQTQGGLPSQPSYAGLKRSFSQTETPAYQEIVQNFRDDSSRQTMNQDHKLLAFRRSQDKHTILDQHGRMQQLELSAQLHGMFFLSEMPPNPADGGSLQPELTCYRRNLFQISGSLVTPRGQLSVVTESGETVPVSSMEVTVSAIESVDGNPVRLIVIPWKTPPPNSPEVHQNPDQEPSSLPLIPFQDDGADADGDFAMYPIGWRRLQFRIATANNGRRKELQQHFVLHLKVMGTLSNNSKVVLTESTTAPIVVRGRSPRNFQARKEIPLLGSSAGSRGQALVETGVGVVAGALKQAETKARVVDLPLPRTAFTFSPPKQVPGQVNPLRSNSYPGWSSSGPAPLSQLPSSGSGAYPPSTMAADPYTKVPLSGASSYAAEPQDIPLQTSMPPPVPLSLVSSDQAQPPMRSPYSYVGSGSTSSHVQANTTSPSASEALSVPRYVDNPRPTKSPRHSSHQSVHSTSSVGNTEASPEYRYGTYAPVTGSSADVAQTSYASDPSGSSAAPSRDYYPSSGGWATSAAGEHNPSVGYTSNEARAYSFGQDHYKTGASGPAPVKTESSQSNSSSVYGGGPRGSFDTMNNYSWSSS
jgi:hypothetical protein